MDKGWIKLHRSIQEHWLFQEKRTFSKFEAWVDMIMMANHKDNKFLLGNELIKIKRGSFITSELKLMDRWNWSKTKVRNFLNLLESESMIIKVPDSKKTTIKIVKYELYQSEETIEKPEKDQQKTIEELEKNHEGTSKELRKNTNKNVKNDKNNVCMYDENLKNIVRLLEENIGVIPPILIDEINEYSKIFDIKMFGEAIKIAAGNKSRNVPYVLGILRNWKDDNILTIDDLEALRREKEIEKQRKQQKHQYQNKQYNKPKKTRFHNFEQRTDKYSADDLEAIAERKREEALRKMREQNQF
ncbi:DnaD domain protein [Anaerosalibacter massiliensis]|uniref:DnaD domain protein n=1 Tax=Anaerosalibacter massiliensis TaxID=1347392 RepID=A0A9X2S645_9FIRM|nr:DnaD domain protein [Anaerosalibacter massiliensis]MCR2043217.1 DnaD domain protein [Anaerosalibacter massiliensis]